MQSVSYYSLEELVAQRNNCIALGLNPSGIQFEIDAVVKEHLALWAARRRHPSNFGRDVIAEATDITSAVNRVFDQDVD